MIEPAVLKGFRDSLPEEEIPKKRIIRILEDVFSSYGFVPIDTPVLEYTEVLLGKGGGETDKQIFRFQDNGGRQVAMRFDLTVPFARFLAMHHDKLGVPFKRYHINKVWRGENHQKGRYREFIQCDFDIVGADNAEADYEILSMMHRSFSALGIDGYTFHLSHRALFSAFLAHIGIENKSIDILRTVDKMRKIGTDEVRKPEGCARSTAWVVVRPCLCRVLHAIRPNILDVFDGRYCVRSNLCGASAKPPFLICAVGRIPSPSVIAFQLVRQAEDIAQRNRLPFSPHVYVGILAQCAQVIRRRA